MCSINHDLKAIFIHIPKTAGTYLADVLHKHYGFKNYYITRHDHLQFCRGYDNSIKSHENKIHGTLIYYKTSPHCNRIMGMTPEKWDTYYKFCFVRNPYDKIVSGWNYVNQGKYPFMFYLNKPFKKNAWDYWHVLMPQMRHIINEKGKVGVDFIGKNENLEEDFEKVLNKLGLTPKHRQGKKNVKKHDKFYKYYNQQILNKVNLLLKEDFDQLSDYYSKFDDFSQFFIHFSNPNSLNLSNLSNSSNIEIKENNNLKIELKENINFKNDNSIDELIKEIKIKENIIQL